MYLCRSNSFCDAKAYISSEIIYVCAPGRSCVLVAARGCLWVLLGYLGLSRALLGALGSPGLFWTLLAIKSMRNPIFVHLPLPAPISYLHLMRCFYLAHLPDERAYLHFITSSRDQSSGLCLFPCLQSTKRQRPCSSSLISDYLSKLWIDDYCMSRSISNLWVQK